MCDFEDILEELGTFGPFQISAFVIVSLFETPAAWAMVLPVFTTSTPSWVCSDNASFAGSAQIHGDNGSMEYAPTGNGTSYTSSDNASCDRFREGHCDIVYTSPMTSIVTEWELTCTDELTYASTWLKMLQMTGVFVGAFIAGQLADVFGRKKVLFGVYTLMLLLGFASSFSNTWQLYTALRCLVGGCIGGTMVVNFVLPIELVGKQWRTFCGCIGFWAVGIATLPLLAYFLPNWRHLSMVCSAGGSLLLFSWRFVPESPRWLIRKGRVEEAYEILKQMAKWNKKPAPDISRIQGIIQREKLSHVTKKYSYWDLFRTPAMTRNSLIVLYAWFVCGCVYYGTTFGVEHLSGNLHLNLFLSGIVEIPALLYVVIVNNKIGRRVTLASLMLLAGLSLFAILIIDVAGKKSELSVLVTTLAHIGKAGIAGAWAATQVSSAELFPTVIRNIGIGASSMSARIGGIAAPQIANLGTTSVVLPYVIFGAMGLICAFFAIFLPETLNKPLPETVPAWSYPCCHKSVNLTGHDDDDETIQNDTYKEKVTDTEMKLLSQQTNCHTDHVIS